MLAFLSRHRTFKSCRPFPLVIKRPFFRCACFFSSALIGNADIPNGPLYLYIQMQRLGLAIDSFTALSALRSCSSLSSDVSLIRHLHAHLVKINLESDVYVGTALLNGYVVSCFSHACQLFDQMPERSVVTWNTMLSGFSKKGELRRARWLFDNMPMRDNASWAAMIGGYTGAGMWRPGLELFREMLKNGSLKPDSVMLVTLLSGCSHMGVLPLLGKSIHAYLERNAFELDVVLGTALVDMYAKCGLLQSASWIFELLSCKNVMSWTAMICGLALHGQAESALALFQRMKEAGVRPNEFTFTGVLSACHHAGLVKEGRKQFYSMAKEFGIEPGIYHYGCMVDLLGKAGLLEETYNFIQAMRLKPNIVIWCSFLGSCKLHRNFELAERTIDQVLHLVDPDKDGGVFALISDIYASNGKWDDAVRVRLLMNKQNVKKARGSSFIEVGQPRQFASFST